MFDAYLAERGDERPFDLHDDYDEHVDGKPRDAGVRDFLASRGIALPEGGAGDPRGVATVAALSAAKNAEVQRRIQHDGVTVFEGSRRYLETAAAAGLRRAVVSSSANTAQVLEVTGLASLVEVRVDGVTLHEEPLAGKPAPDSFLAGARRLGVDPA